jgi:hypothetical protein
LEGAQCVPCDAASAGAGNAMFQARIPLQPLWLQGRKSFLVNFARTGQPSATDPNPEISYWRGNESSVDEPVVYARAKLVTPSAGSAPDAATSTSDSLLTASVPHAVPLNAAMTLDGKISPKEWSDSLVLSGFQPHEKEGDLWRGGTPELSRIQLTADKENLYLLFAFLSRVRGGTLKLLVAADAKSAPVWVAVDRQKGTITASAPSVTDGIQCAQCTDDPFLAGGKSKNFSSATYECRIPLKSLGIHGQPGFLANARFDRYSAGTAPDSAPAPSWSAYWRGNPDTAADPATYERFIFANRSR